MLDGLSEPLSFGFSFSRKTATTLHYQKISTTLVVDTFLFYCCCRIPPSPPPFLSSAFSNFLSSLLSSSPYPLLSFPRSSIHRLPFPKNFNGFCLRRCGETSSSCHGALAVARRNLLGKHVAFDEIEVQKHIWNFLHETNILRLFSDIFVSYSEFSNNPNYFVSPRQGLFSFESGRGETHWLKSFRTRNRFSV